MAINARLSAETLRNQGVDLAADFHTIDSNAVEAILEAARASNYRKPKNANGSTARYFFAAPTQAQ